MATRAIAIENVKTGEVTEAVYEHPFVVRLCHWVNAVSLFVMAGSGLQIFRAFPSFVEKSHRRISSTGPKLSRSADGWEARSSGTSPLCGSTSGPDCCISATRSSAETTSRCSLHDVISLACGRWCATTSFSAKAARQGSLQRAAEARIHLCDRTGRTVGADGSRYMETSPVLVASVDHGRLSLGAVVAFPDHVGDAGVRVRASGDGGAPWLE